MRAKYHTLAPAPSLTAPFVLIRSAAAPSAGILVTPFPRRRQGPTDAEAARVEAVAARLVGDRRPSTGTFWIDPATGVATPASIGEGQLRRKLTDCASFTVRWPGRPMG